MVVNFIRIEGLFKFYWLTEFRGLNYWHFIINFLLHFI